MSRLRAWLVGSVGWLCTTQGHTAPYGVTAYNPTQDHHATIKVARIFEEDRVLRTPGMIPPDRERAQGRILCVPKVPKGSTPNKAAILKQRYQVANAFLAFEDDVAIVNRHNFMDERGRETFKVTNCFFEHMESGDLVRFVKAESTPQPTTGKSADINNEDVAVVELERVPGFGTPQVGKSIPVEDIEIDADLGGRSLQVVSNFANNLPTGLAPDAKTFTSCDVISFDQSLLEAYRRLKAGR